MLAGFLLLDPATPCCSLSSRFQRRGCPGSVGFGDRPLFIRNVNAISSNDRRDRLAENPQIKKETDPFSVVVVIDDFQSAVSLVSKIRLIVSGNARSYFSPLILYIARASQPDPDAGQQTHLEGQNVDNLRQ